MRGFLAKGEELLGALERDGGASLLDVVAGRNMYIRNPTPETPNLKLQTRNSKFQTANRKPQTPNPKPYTQHPAPCTPHPTPQTLSPKP